MASLTSPLARRRLEDRTGNALVEFALVLPLLLFVFAGIVDFGFMFQRHEVLTNAVREGARLAVLPANYGAGVIQQRVTDYVTAGLGSATGLTVGAPQPAVLNTVPPYRTVQVSATLRSSYLILGPVARLIRGGGSWDFIDLSATATMRTEVGP
jgi:Flp pilus assembly protein TadG